MGEEAKQEQPKAEAKEEEKKEEKVEEKPSEEKKEESKEEKPAEEEKKEEPKPPSPCVLFVDLHCVGCAKKIQRSIMKMRGVEGVVIDMAKNEVTIKGIVEPQAICNTITKKTKRRANVISPLPPAEGEPIPEVVNSQVSGPETVELNVNMHCEACAEQLKKKILQMRGVQTAVTEFSTGKVTVTGTMDANKLVDYVYRRTKKQAKIVPQPEPEKKEEEGKEGDEKKPAASAEEEAKPEENKKEEEKSQEEQKKEEGSDENNKNENKEEKGSEEGKEEGKKEENNGVVVNIDEEGIKRMMYYYQYPPLYVIERIPPPQLFSDENPNACSIS
ncbi:heavy metal-associated isoprenylated plant protein 9-like [Cicer arietinum]|uniref:Heavy metal-associated isoprenylated plant protein 9-like n=1 Tax=Cicer arietinum TaxID=3827 RepID=A0A1S2XK27_CICAR|nr:heavy metal-associated isoprenylated plant protein 9-like [Cicer arietinum]